MRSTGTMSLLCTAWFVMGGAPAAISNDDDLPPVQAIAVGDFNGDGTPDIAAGLPDVGTGKLRKAGEVRLFSGKRGTLLTKIHGRQKEEEYGNAIAAIGDLDGDGATDLAIGSWRASPSARVDFISGKTGKTLRSRQSSEPMAFGIALCTVGDGAGKGPVDLLIFEGNANHWLYTDPKKDGNLSEGDESAGLRGSARWVGDIDGDGRADFALSAWSEDAGKTKQAGRIRVMSGGLLRDGNRKAELFLLRGSADWESLGLVVGAAGDFNGDGKGDLLSGTSGGADPNAPWTVRVLSGKDGAELWKVAGEKGDYAIGGVAMVGDLDGDGKPDLAVGSPERKGKAGAVSVVSTKDGMVLWTVEGRGGEKLGDQILSIPDSDGDGGRDLCVVAPGKNVGCVRFLSGQTGKVITLFNPVL